MEISDRITALIEAVEQARSVPLSSNCLINRSDLLAALTAMRDSVPSEFQEAQRIIEERDEIIARGQREVERLAAEGKAEKARLVSTHEITLAAEAEATRITKEAHTEAQRIRNEMEKYVETSLANFEQLLERTMDGIQRGRNRLSAVVGFDSNATLDAPTEKPLPF